MVDGSASDVVSMIVGDDQPSRALRDWAEMLLIRRFEEVVRERKLAGEVAGSVHLAIGQEAVPVGVVQGIRSDRDVVFATYRGHGWALATGSPLQRLFAEILGRVNGVNGGRAGSAYLSDPSVGFMGENSIVGAGASHAVGAALQGVFDGTGRRSVAVFGDGAMNQGAVHEAMNFAAFKRLPVLFIVENNFYSEMTPISAMVGDDQLFKRAAAYGFEGVRVDGNDPAILRELVSAWSRSEPGPMLVEAMTQRLVGHYVGDAEVYRPRGEVESLADVEPVAAARRRLEEGHLDGDHLDRIDEEVTRAVTAALHEARLSDLSSPEHARSHIYA